MDNKNYINIQGWMINDLKLKGNELVLYAIIYGFSQDGKSEYYGSYSYVAKALHVTERSVQSLFKKLLDKKIIKRISESHYRVEETSIEGRRNFHSGVEETSIEGRRNFHSGVEETSIEGRRNFHSGVEETSTNNNNTNNKDNNIFSFTKEKERLLNTKDKINLIALDYINYKKYNFLTRDEYSKHRYTIFSNSKTLASYNYSQKEIRAMFDYAENNYKSWTLNAIAKNHLDIIKQLTK